MPINVSFPMPVSPRILPPGLMSTKDLEIDVLLRAPQARSTFGVDGSGLAAAVLDTGLRVTHRCFNGRVVEARNFTTDDNGAIDNVSDYNGHGTNVAGIIAAGTYDERRGIAPAANIIPLKVLPANDMTPIFNALLWVYENSERLNISVANLSLGAQNINLSSDKDAAHEMKEFCELLDALVEKRIAVVVAAGNSYYQFQAEGMSIPAIFQQTISVGAVYDASFGPRSYMNGAEAYNTHADRITPFTQRLSKETSPDCYTDVFSAGGAATSAGAKDDDATSIQDGTSQAAPTVAGVILLLQQYYLRMKGELPTVPLLQDLLRASSAWIYDGDDEENNVKPSNQKYPRVDAFQSLTAMHRAIQLGSI